MPVKAEYAAKLAYKDVPDWIMQNEPVVAEFLKKLPSRYMDTYEMVLPQTTTVSDANVSFIDEDVSLAVGETSLDPDISQTVRLVRMVGDVAVNSMVMAYTLKPLWLEYKVLMQALYYRLTAAAIKDDGTDGKMKGAAEFIDTVGDTNNIAMSGAPLTASVLTQLIMEKMLAGMPDFLMTNSRGLVKVDELVRASGYSPNMVWDEKLKRMVHLWCGIPVIVDDHIPVTSGTPDVTDLYAFRVGWGRGLCLLHSAPGGHAINVRRISKPEDDQERYRVSMDCALMVPSSSVIARVTGFEV